MTEKMLVVVMGWSEVAVVAGMNVGEASDAARGCEVHDVNRRTLLTGDGGAIVAKMMMVQSP